MRGRSIWRRRLLTWLLPASFVLLNLLLFFGNRLVLGVRLLALESELAARQERHAELGAELAHRQDLLTRAEAARQDLETLYQDRLASKRERLTLVLAHVRELARRAGLDPESFTYPEATLEDQGLEKLSFVFSVEGDFSSLRQFVSLIEATDEFLTLEQISVSEASGATANRLAVQLTLSTLFAVEEPRPGAST